ncbi:hypothetical protein BD414DRAFT_469089 [Trametes punicea]|nr:hypothetical protein BD414DRAFT_469089 [Trametes punicea]
MSSPSGQPAHSTASILFSFLLSFLGLSVLSILGGLIWQRVASRRWRTEALQVTFARSLLDQTPRPELWDVCIRDALSAPKLSDCAWDQLSATEPRVGSLSPYQNSGSLTRSGLPPHGSAFRRNELAFQTNVDNSDAAEDGVSLHGCNTAIVMVIAYPCCAIKGELGEFALGIAHTFCKDPGGRGSLAMQ